MRALPSKLRHIAIIILFAAASPACAADAEPPSSNYDEPPEYIYKQNYREIDADALIARCDAASAAQRNTPVTSVIVEGVVDYKSCLRQAVLESWDEFFTPAVRERNDLDRKLDLLIDTYANIYGVIYNEQAGCDPIFGCGTLYHGFGASMAINMLKQMLRDMQEHQADHQPQIRNPFYDEWIKAGLPADWPADRMVPKQ